MSKPIYFFSKNDRYFEMSNYYPQGFEDEEGYCPTVEHYFQAAKFPGSEHKQYRERIRTSGSPKQAKALGQTRKISIRSDWESVKENVMLYALRNKFANKKLKALLLSTNNRQLIENSPFDKYWGIGKNKNGKNRLGQLLMMVRDEFGKVQMKIQGTDWLS